MNKYNIPQIKIMRFVGEMVVTVSEPPQREYIQEVGALQSMLGDNSEEYKARMESFSQLMTFSN